MRGLCPKTRRAPEMLSCISSQKMTIWLQPSDPKWDSFFGTSLQPRPGPLMLNLLHRVPQLQPPWWHFADAGKLKTASEFQHMGQFFPISSTISPVMSHSSTAFSQALFSFWLRQPNPHLSAQSIFFYMNLPFEIRSYWKRKLFLKKKIPATQGKVNTGPGQTSAKDAFTFQ